MFHGQADVIKTIQQAITPERIDLEIHDPAAGLHGLILKVYGYPERLIALYLGKQKVDFIGAQGNWQQTILE